MAYYYIGNNNSIQGPFSEKAYAGWYAERSIPAETVLFDDSRREYPIAHVVEKFLKSRTKIIFETNKALAETTADHTRLDVTLDLDQTYRNESTFLHPDFTQIDEEVDEVDCAGGLSEQESPGVHLLKMVSIYLERRAVINRRRRFPDNFVPFEMPWPAWVPSPLSMPDALRGTVHLHNCLQEFDADLFSDYLATLNIFAHPCRRCHVDFKNAHEMLIHFVSIPHVHRMYTQSSPQVLSMIDVYCVQKMMSEVEALEEADGEVLLNPFEPVDSEPTFFDSADVAQAFDSLKSTVILMQRVPLLEPARETSDTCEYIEALVLLRAFESNYLRTHPAYRRRRFGIIGKTKCTCCNVDFDATLLEAFPKHLFSEEHLYNALHLGISRTQLEYWLSFLRAIVKGVNAADWRFKSPAEKSLQECDFPLCYQLSTPSHGDFEYSGGDVEPVLNFVRNKIRDHLPLLDDFKYRTRCMWCRVELCSKNGVLRHVLYDKIHVDRLRSVSNDDLRRLLKVLDLQTTMPLLQESSRRLHRVMTPSEKQEALQKVTNVAWLKHKKREIWATAARSFPMGLVNRCELCRVDVEHVDGIIMHLCTEKHVENVVNNARIVDADFNYWMQIFQVNSGRRSQ